MRARGEDHHAAIEIALEDALNGAEREISLRAQDHRRARPAAVGEPHAEREDPARRAARPVHPPRRPGPARPRRRAGGRPVPGGAHRAARALPHRGARPVHDAAGHAERGGARREGEVPTPTGGVVDVTVPPTRATA